jgi:hypothetical protein
MLIAVGLVFLQRDKIGFPSIKKGPLEALEIGFGSYVMHVRHIYIEANLSI